MITSNKITLNKELSYPISLTGGLNEQVSNMELSAGELLICKNYVDQEDVYSGYQSAKGYERYDGQALASAISVTADEMGEVTDDTAREAQRALILTVGGTAATGAVTGVHMYGDELYAWRNKSDDSETYLYVESATGWDLMDTSGTPMDPDATVRAINGRFSLFNTNNEIMAWVDGVTEGFFMFDGTTITYTDNTSTGGLLPNAAPVNIGIWRNRLFLIYPQGHILFSAPGDPEDFDTSTSTAGEIYLGDNCTDINEGPSGTLALFTKDTIKLLYYGSVTDDFVFKLDTFSSSVGAKEQTAKSILGNIYFADGQGICSLSTTQTYGDFGAKNIAKKAQKTFDTFRNDIQFSMIDTNTGRYYLFYEDDLGTSSALVLTFKGTHLKGITKVVYKHLLNCICEAKYADGRKAYFFGTTTGYVMKMFSGTSFDGATIDTLLTTSYYHYNSPRVWKFFHRLRFEASSPGNFDGSIRTRFNYSESIMPRTSSGDFDVYGSPGHWGEDVWGSFYWSSAAIGGSMYYFTGYGTNMSITISTSSKYKDAHIMHNYTVDYSLQSVQV